MISQSNLEFRIDCIVFFVNYSLTGFRMTWNSFFHFFVLNLFKFNVFSQCKSLNNAAVHWPQREFKAKIRQSAT